MQGSGKERRKDKEKDRHSRLPKEHPPESGPCKLPLPPCIPPWRCRKGIRKTQGADRLRDRQGCADQGDQPEGCGIQLPAKENAPRKGASPCKDPLCRGGTGNLFRLSASHSMRLLSDTSPLLLS